MCRTVPADEDGPAHQNSEQEETQNIVHQREIFGEDRRHTSSANAGGHNGYAADRDEGCQNRAGNSKLSMQADAAGGDQSGLGNEQ